MTAARNLTLNLSLAALSTGLVCLALEGVARIAESRTSPVTDRGLQLYMEPDPVVGWRHRPNAHAVFPLGEYTVDVAINSRGLRDPERDYATPANTWRLLALGDSFVEGFSVPAEKTLTQVLERSMSREACPVEVLNGGTAAYSTDQEYLFYTREGFKYSPNVVVLFFFFNDVLGNINNEGKSVLRLEGDTLVPRDGAIPPPRSKKRAPAPSPAPKGHSALVRWVAKRMKLGAPRGYDLLAKAGFWPRIPREAARSDFQVYELGPNPQVEESWDLTEKVLKALAQSVAARGSQFLVAYVPSRIEVSSRDWELTSLRYGWNEGNASRFRVVKRLGRILRSLGIPLLDLTPALQHATWGPFRSPYYVEDFHWNALGHEVAAAEVEHVLRDKGWLPSCAHAP